jgi:Mg2+-importing ATPase
MRPTNHQQVLPKHLFDSTAKQKRQIEVASLVVESASMDAAGVYARLTTRATGLTSEEATKRFAEHGPNVLARDQRASLGRLFWNAMVNPLTILLLVLTTVSFATSDVRAGIVMSLMEQRILLCGGRLVH